MSLHVRAILLITLVLFANASGFTHWLVTEDGKIQYQVLGLCICRNPVELKKKTFQKRVCLEI